MAQAEASTESTVTVRITDGVARVTLNRPHRHNSLVPDFLAEITAAFQRVDRDTDVKIAVLAAAGESFSTGGDLAAVEKQGSDRAAYADRLVGALNETILSIVECDKPVIAVVDGQVTGGALGLVLACDVTLVTERASFTPYYVDVGFSPDGGWSAMLPYVIGRQRAAAVQMLNDTIDAQTAVDWGLAYRVVGSGKLEQTVEEVCDTLLQKIRGSLGATKALLRQADLRERLERERIRFVEQITNPESVHGVSDFLMRGKKR